MAKIPRQRRPVLLALELMQVRPEAEAIVTAYLKAPGADIDHAARLCRSAGECAALRRRVAQLETVTRQQPDLAPPG